MRSRAPSRGRRRVLVDTSAFYAFADESDAHYREAAAVFSDLTENGDYLFTTSFIVAETHALLLNRLHRQAAIRFLQDTDEGTHLAILWITPDDVRRARNIVYRYEDKRFSLTDATSFVVMKRLRIPTTRYVVFETHARILATGGADLARPEDGSVHS